MCLLGLCLVCGVLLNWYIIYLLNLFWGEDVEDWSAIARKWTEAVKQRGVQCIYLSLLPVDLAPTAIFCCKTVVVMTLESIHVANMLNCVVDLPLLKTLTLWDTVFQAAKDLMKLLSGCPKLEKLKTFCSTSSNRRFSSGRLLSTFIIHVDQSRYHFIWDSLHSRL
jgi:hypothetical protein